MTQENTRSQRFLVSMTPKMIREAARNSKALIILPTGAIEQHGPHLPVGVDSLLGTSFVSRLIAGLNEDEPVWFAPPIWIGKSNEHDGYPGTLSLSGDSFRAQVLSTAEQVKQMGFSRIALLNTHGGNQPVLQTTVLEIETSFGIKASILDSHPITDLDPREEQFGIHAGQYETSLMLAICPDMVEMDKADCYWMDDRFPKGSFAAENHFATFAWKIADFTPSGTLGDATLASASDGERWVTGVIDVLLKQIREKVSG
ncbi:MAG: creatininase family protein [Verrucomicrobiota bacterium]